MLPLRQKVSQDAGRHRDLREKPLPISVRQERRSAAQEPTALGSPATVSSLLEGMKKSQKHDRLVRKARAGAVADYKAAKNRAERRAVIAWYLNNKNAPYIRSAV